MQWLAYLMLILIRLLLTRRILLLIFNYVMHKQNSKLYVALAMGGVQGEESIQKIQSGDQTIILFEGDTVAGKMEVKSGAGAASSELYLIDQRIQKNLDDKSGVTDLRKGVLQSGEESAASVKIRNANSSARPAYRQDIMKDFLQDSFLYLVGTFKTIYAC